LALKLLASKDRNKKNCRELQLVSSFDNTIMFREHAKRKKKKEKEKEKKGKGRGFNILPFHHLLE